MQRRTYSGPGIWHRRPLAISAQDSSCPLPLKGQFCSRCLEKLAITPALDLLDALPKGYSRMEIIWDASAREVTIRGLRWLHPKRITFLESLTPLEFSPKKTRSRGSIPRPSSSSTPLPRPFGLRHKGGHHARVRLDVPIQKLRREGQGGVCRGLRHAATGGKI
jgi:hypothetical protein